MIGGAIAGFSGRNMLAGAAKPGSGPGIGGGNEIKPTWKLGDAENITTRAFWRYGYNPKPSVQDLPGSLSPQQLTDGWRRPNFSSSSSIEYNGKLVTNPLGSVVDISIPSGYSVRLEDNGMGWVYQPPGSVGNANAIRIMWPTVQYPNGYAVFYNGSGAGQAFNPLTGQTLSPDFWHFAFP